MPTPSRNAQVFFRSSPLCYDGYRIVLARQKTLVLHCLP